MKKILPFVLIATILLTIIYVLSYLIPILGPQLLRQVSGNINLKNLGSVNCGTINIYTGFGNDPTSDTREKTIQKLKCFMDSFKICNKSYLRVEFSTWENYQTTSFFRTEKSNGACGIKFEKFSADTRFFKKTKGHCAMLGIYDPGQNATYGFLDVSSCEDE